MGGRWPAAVNARKLNSDYHGARELAAWKGKVRAAWPSVRVEHVESSGVGDAPEVAAIDTLLGARRTTGADLTAYAEDEWRVSSRLTLGLGPVTVQLSPAETARLTARPGPARDGLGPGGCDQASRRGARPWSAARAAVDARR